MMYKHRVMIEFESDHKYSNVEIEHTLTDCRGECGLPGNWNSKMTIKPINLPAISTLPCQCEDCIEEGEANGIPNQREAK